jgi:NAD(P)-dependent dehydrogenase (short-subunit alcohol dehydrogenase family)
VSTTTAIRPASQQAHAYLPIAGAGVTVNAFRPGSVDTAMQACIREQEPDPIGAELHHRFTSYQQGNLISPQQSAQSLLAHLDTDATGRIWTVSSPA